MNKSAILLVSLLLLGGCKKNSEELLSQAEKNFAEANYVDSIDALVLALGHWDDALGNDKKGRAYQLLGQSYQKLRKIEKSEEAYQQAVTLSTNAYPAATELAQLYIGRADYDNAEKSYLRALQMRPNDPLALVGLGNVYYGMKKFMEARAAYTRVLDTSPGVKESLEYLKLVDEKLHLRKSGTSRGAPIDSRQNMIFRRDRF